MCGRGLSFGSVYLLRWHFRHQDVPFFAWLWAIHQSAWRQEIPGWLWPNCEMKRPARIWVGFGAARMRLDFLAESALDQRRSDKSLQRIWVVERDQGSHDWQQSTTNWPLTSLQPPFDLKALKIHSTNSESGPRWDRSPTNRTHLLVTCFPPSCQYHHQEVVVIGKDNGKGLALIHSE